MPVGYNKARNLHLVQAFLLSLDIVYKIYVELGYVPVGHCYTYLYLAYLEHRNTCLAYI